MTTASPPHVDSVANGPNQPQSTGRVPAGFDLVACYRQMLTIRKVEEHILQLRRQDEIAGSVHPCIGQESAAVGVASVLTPDDRVIATYRGHGWALARGVPVYNLLAEVLQREAGTNGGRAGSPYLSSPEHGFWGENSIVGAGLPIANGVAMGLEHAGRNGLVVVSFGDGATNQGSAHEALVFAIARSLPVLFICENNAWSEMTPITDTVPKASLTERARAYGMPAEEVDGRDVHVITAAANRAAALARMGGGPTFLEIHVPRILGHYNADIEHYRSQEDRESHLARDPLAFTRALLLDRQVIGEAALNEMEREVDEAVLGDVERARSAPLPTADTAPLHVVAQASTSTVGPLPELGTTLAYGLAANRALHVELEMRPEVVLFGEDIAIPGGTFGVTRGLRKRFGERVFDTPIAEAAILGAAVGSSTTGMRPVVEIMWMDFLYVAADQLINQAANVRYLSRGAVSAPLVVRMQQGVSPGSCAQHAQSLEAVLAHIPGIKVGLPSTPHDAFMMLRAAIADPDPVVIIESRVLYLQTGTVDVDSPVEAASGARLRRAGSDALIVTWGQITNSCLQAADRLEAEDLDVAVLDLRWLSPLDDEAIHRSLVAAGGKVLIVHEANLTGGFGAEVAARITERHFHELDAPIKRLGAPDVRIPSSPVLQSALVPSVDKIVAEASVLARS